MPSRLIDLSTRTIVSAFLYAILVWALIGIRDLLYLVVFSLILALALNPLVRWLGRRYLPRPIAVGLVFAAIVGFILLFFFTLLPVLQTEFAAVSTAMPEMVSKAAASATRWLPDSSLSAATNAIPASLEHAANAAVAGLRGAFSSVWFVIALLVLTYYLLLEDRRVHEFLHALTPSARRPAIDNTIATLENRMSHWLRGQLLLGLIIGLMSFIGLVALGIEFAFALALIAGLSELVPTIGPYLGMIPAALVGFSQSPGKGVAVLILYWIIQQAENNFIVPKVMSKASGTNPLAIVIALLIGAKVAGVIGILLSVPAVIILMTIFEGRRLPGKAS